MTSDILFFAIASISLPLAGAAFCFLFIDVARTLGRAISVLTLSAALFMAFEVALDGYAGPVRYALGGWDEPLAINLRIDGLAVLSRTISGNDLDAMMVHKPGL